MKNKRQTDIRHTFTLGIKTLAYVLSVLMILYAVPTIIYADLIETVEGVLADDTVVESTGETETAVNQEIFEAVERREETVKHFRMPDGSFVAVQYDLPVHQLDAQGDWQDIDNTLSADGSDYATSNARVKFAKKITGNETLFTLHEGNHKITMSLVGARKKVQGQVTNTQTEFGVEATQLQKMMTLDKLSSRILYADILDGVDLEYVVESRNVKENIIVKEKADEYAFSFEMKLNNATATLCENGDITITDPDTAEVIYTIPKGFMYDAAGAFSDAVSYTLTSQGNGTYTLAVVADADWINEEGRAFPVTVDPPINSGASSTLQDTYVDSANLTSYYYDFGYLAAGHGSSGQEFISYVKSPLPTLPQSAYVTSATLELYCQDYRNHSTSYEQLYLGLFLVENDWTSGLTWSTYANATKGDLSSSYYDYAKLTAATEGQYVSWDMTSIVNDWYEGTANYGVAIRQVGGSYNVDALLASATATANRPRIVIDYCDMKGTESYWTYATQSGGLAGTGSINLATGDLVFSKSLLSTTDSLMAYAPMIVYNSSLVDQEYEYPNVQISYWGTMMPNGFKFSVQETLIKKSFYTGDNVQKYFYVWADGDATEHYFMPVGDSTTQYKDEDGLQLTLDVSGSTATITDSNYTVRTFSKLSGVPESSVLEGWYLRRITDKSGNQMILGFESGPRPNKISVKPYNSTQIDYLTISYNTDASPYIIWNQATKEAMIFKYSSTATGSISSSAGSYLRQVIYAHGNSAVTAQNWLDFYNNSSNTTNITVDATAYYTYDVNGQLIRVEDGLSNYALAYTYSNGKVVAVQEYGRNSAVGQKITISYSGFYTEVRTSGTDDIYGNTDDIITRYVFDKNGRVITSYSMNYSYNELYGITSGSYDTETANNIKTSTVSSGNSANYLLNGSFEKSGSSLTYWDVSGSVSMNSGSRDDGINFKNAQFSATPNSTGSISQYVFLRPGDYTLSLDIGSFEAQGVSVVLTAQSISDATRNFTKELSVNKFFASSIAGFDYLTFDAQNKSNGGEVFKISISVVADASVSANSDVWVDNVMLSKANGPQVYNMVSNGDFENTNVTSQGSTQYGPGTFWHLTDESTSAGLTYVTDANPFKKVLRLKSTIGEECVAEQTVYSATSQTLTGFQYGPQVFNISGSAYATSVMGGNNAQFALAFSIKYYSATGNSEPIVQYYDFCKDTTAWQYVSGSFVVPAGKAIQEIKVYCVYSGNSGMAYFDNISVTLDSEGTTTWYNYDDQGRTTLSVAGNDVVVYEYYSDGDLKAKTTRNGRTVYYYDACHRLIYEDYYSHSASISIGDNGSVSIGSLGSQELVTSAEYQYNDYGLIWLTSVYAENSNDDYLITSQTEYNVSAGSKIFGSISRTMDSLGKVTKYFHDETNGRLLATIQPDGTGTCYSYDVIGNLISVQPAKTSSTSWAATTGSANVEYNYNSLNQLESLSTNGTEYQFTYNAFGAKTSVAIGDNTIVSQTYNSNNGKVKSVTYANGTTATYTYDHLDRISKLVYNNNGTLATYEYEYDSNGNLSRFVDQRLRRATLYRYDNNGRMMYFLEYDIDTLENLSSADYSYNDKSLLSFAYYSQDYIYNSSSYENLSYVLDYTYNEFDNVSGYLVEFDDADFAVSPEYDDHQRIISKNIQMSDSDSSVINHVTYDYVSSGVHASTVVSEYTTQINSRPMLTYYYTYDSANANITQITDASGTILQRFTYDDLGQLIREDNYDADRTYVYTYDADGNILTKTIYGFTTALGTPTTTLYNTYRYTYGNSNWGDQLTEYRGGTITYDAIGNPLSYYNGSRMTMTWTNGSNLASVTKGSVLTTYTYNDAGIRTGKTVGGAEHIYTMDGSMILSEAYDGKLFIYVYDENGSPIGFRYREDSYAQDVFDDYLYQKNLQGDITGIYRENGTQVVWYDYDAWGNCIGAAWVVHDQDIYKNLYYSNPFRYRGYYWDSETGFYYCGSRYYDPVTGRFINADSTNTLMNTPMALTDKNLYAYCDNNPVMRVDHGGEFWDTVFDVVSLCFSVADVIQNPDDPWAWVGLAADVVSLVVPFATGGGLIVDAITHSDEVVDLMKYGDDVVETVVAHSDEVLDTTNKTLKQIKQASESLEKGTDYVYVARNQTTNIIEYVGITNDFDRRAAEWARKGRKIEHYIDNVSRDSARILEQTVIETFGMKKNGGILLNKINSISPKKALYQAVEAFKDLIK